MLITSIQDDIKKRLPNFKIGMITYQGIVVDHSPQMLRGRLQFFQEEIKVNLETTPLTSLAGIKEWREIFKTLGIDPTRYRPSSEALYQRIKKGQSLPLINSAVDLNNFFSLQHEIPLGIYDLDQLQGPVEYRIGQEEDQFLGINGRVNQLKNKLISADADGPFGSPIVDSKRTIVTEKTKNALHIVYLKESMQPSEANKLLSSLASMFTQVHGGEATPSLIT
ncbi:B3/B4 domain-containing protein [Desertibacillus haloalkaliphilus]|uniref:B3/B4 domain-containing protein n=1 Tax=Desertibacillus haloalkaliphilus TaxID=1328930 RepID=UPI0028B0B074|nr:phenylalanine--tRNA ligase beta subunit-related protein [Desertibacillus haloalkaliphilus]